MTENADDESTTARRVVHRTREMASEMREKLGKRRFERSPEGRARTAYADGDSIFQLREEMDEIGHGRLLASIEGEGWELSDTQYVPETESTTDSFGNSSTKTKVFAIYVFRRKIDSDNEPLLDDR